MLPMNGGKTLIKKGFTSQVPCVCHVKVGQTGAEARVGGRGGTADHCKVLRGTFEVK